MTTQFQNANPAVAPAVAAGFHGGEWIEAMQGERVAVRVHNSTVGGRYSLVEVIARPGVTTPLHTHDADEVFYILAGRVRLAVAGRIVDAGAGDVIRVPAGDTHAWIVRGEEEAHMLALFVPGGFEDIFEHVAGATPAEILLLAPCYGADILGPSPFAD